MTEPTSLLCGPAWFGETGGHHLECHLPSSLRLVNRGGEYGTAAGTAQGRQLGFRESG